MDEPTPERLAEMVARDLLMLCQRAKMQLLKGHLQIAADLLDNAPRFAGRIGIKPDILRSEQPSTKRSGATSIH